jgi:hypothetical protein
LSNSPARPDPISLTGEDVDDSTIKSLVRKLILSYYRNSFTLDRGPFNG